MAILPFTDAEAVKSGSGVPRPVLRSLRIVFHNHFAATRRYSMLNPFVADARLASCATSPDDMTSERLADLLNVDAVVQGEITESARTADGLRTNVELAVSVALRQLRPDQELWKFHLRSESHLPAPASAETAAAELLGRVFGRPGRGLIAAADDAAEQLMGELDLPRNAPESRIDFLGINPPAAALAPGAAALNSGAELDLTLFCEGGLDLLASTATGGAVADFKEERPGRYSTRLPISRKAEADATAVVIKPRGTGPAVIDPFHVFAIDATPPQPPEDVTPSTMPNGIVLKWQAAHDVPAYRVERSVGHGAFKNIGEVNESRLADKDAKPSTSNAYRVTAIDGAGNESSPSEPVEVMLPAMGPSTLPEKIKRDTILPAYGSPYVFQGDVTVVDGATLTIRPGAELHGLGNKLRVRGRLSAVGTSDAPVIFRGKVGKSTLSSWGGIILDGAGSSGSVLKHCTIKGARAGVMCSACEPEISRCRFHGNVTGIECMAGATPKITHCRFAGNMLRAVTVRHASPLVRSNSFLKEDRVSVEERPGKQDLNGNWWGELEPTRIRRRISGPALLTNCLEAPPPPAAEVSVEALKHYEEAVQTQFPATKAIILQKAIKTDDAFSRGYFELARLYSDAGQATRGMHLLKTCAERNPDNARAWLEYGGAARASGDFPTALAAFEKASEVARESTSVQYALGVTAARLGHLEEAARRLDRYTQRVRGSYRALRLLGEVLARQGEVIDAHRPLRQAAEAVRGQSVDRVALVQIQLATVLLELGRGHEARARLASVVNRMPLDTGIRNIYGAALIRSGAIDAGLQQWAESVRLQSETAASGHLEDILDEYGL